MYHYATTKFHNFTRYFGILLEDTHNPNYDHDEHLGL